MMTRTNKLIFTGIGIASLVFLFRKKRTMLRDELENYIKLLHPAVQNKFRDFVDEVEKKTGYKVVITSSHRGYDKSVYIWNTNSQVRACCRVGYDYHFYGLALDMVLVSPSGTYLNMVTPKQTWESTGIREIARKYDMRWGIDFYGYYDPVHFDIPLYDVNDMANKAISKYGSIQATGDNGNRLDFSGLSKRNYQPA
ncbi:M15 family peptidase [bacterium]|nr:M15 family peptidase [bacterium]NDD83706.1 M15 family peptidase [bacterium]NDG32064.1 M15 family peptidase [bacterium]